MVFKIYTYMLLKNEERRIHYSNRLHGPTCIRIQKRTEIKETRSNLLAEKLKLASIEAESKPHIMQSKQLMLIHSKLREQRRRIASLSDNSEIQGVKWSFLKHHVTHYSFEQTKIYKQMNDEDRRLLEDLKEAQKTQGDLRPLKRQNVAEKISELSGSVMRDVLKYIN